MPALDRVAGLRNDWQQYPRTLSFYYWTTGTLHTLTRDDEHGGYDGCCPRCGREARLWIGDVPGATHVIVRSDPLKLSPSIACPHGCGWHVLIQRGEARDV